VRQGVHRCFGAIAPGVARGLKLRHDHGSNYMSGDFQDVIECLGIEASPSFVREPEGNGVAERFIRTSHGEVQVKAWASAVLDRSAATRSLIARLALSNASLWITRPCAQKEVSCPPARFF
jgi:transposase InsO family protein